MSKNVYDIRITTKYQSVQNLSFSDEIKQEDSFMHSDKNNKQDAVN